MTDEKIEIEEQDEETTEEVVDDSLSGMGLVDAPSETAGIDIPELDLEDYEPPEEEEAGIADESVGSVRFAFIGAGQGGGRIVKSFFDLGYKKAFVVNTAQHDLDKLALPDNRKLILNLNNGGGAGKNMDVGAAGIARYKQEIFETMRKLYGKVDHIMIAVGAGGGTGGGSALGLVGIALKYMQFLGYDNPHERVGVFMSLPTRGEANSPLVASNSLKVLNSIGDLAAKNEISPLVIIDNAKIDAMYKGLTVKQFWPTVNRTVSGLFDIFNRLSSYPSPYTAFDPTDYSTVIRAGGVAVMGVTSVKNFTDPEALAKAVKNNIEKTLLVDIDISKAKVAASIAVGGKDIIENTAGLQDSLSYGFDMLSSLCPDAVIHRGIYEDDKNSLRIYTIIGGLGLPESRLRQLESVKGSTKTYP